MTTFETMMLMLQTAIVVVLILSFRDKEEK
ncbi:hypothetical protein SAMN05421737_109100 [Shouchella lonarensis]|uniref:Holin-like Toxin (Hol-Tox) n=1 Tax=Shouchella lonarensis TaxID=1464122 RepID=A0A1G6M678_9BACI|nr:hypothetical protein SAMN05421737_109100 [Shouchella lonarensis]